MKNLSVLMLALGSVSLGWIADARGAEVLLDEALVRAADASARNKPYEIKRWGFWRKLWSYEIGVPASPYFVEAASSVALRRYQKGDCCIEVRFEGEVNRARKISCDNLTGDIELPGHPGYRLVKVSELADQQQLGGFEFWQSDARFVLKGVVRDEASVREDEYVYGRRDLRQYGWADFAVTRTTTGAVSLDSKNGLNIRQEHKIVAGAYSFIGEKQSLVTAQVDRGPGELVFFDGSTSVILVNRQILSGGFRDSLLERRSEYDEFLRPLAEKSRREPVCFRDAWYQPGSRDCHHMVLNQDPATVVRRHAPVLIRVDFEGGEGGKAGSVAW